MKVPSPKTLAITSDALQTLTDMTMIRFFASPIITRLTSCDPVHQLKLENKTSKSVVVIYRPLIDIAPTVRKIERFDINGVIYAKTILEHGQVMNIGTVVARYNPRPDDVELNFLKVCIDNDSNYPAAYGFI